MVQWVLYHGPSGCLDWIQGNHCVEKPLKIAKISILFANIVKAYKNGFKSLQLEFNFGR